jgi:hypothetical protein
MGTNQLGAFSFILHSVPPVDFQKKVPKNYGAAFFGVFGPHFATTHPR